MIRFTFFLLALLLVTTATVEARRKRSIDTVDKEREVLEADAWEPDPWKHEPSKHPQSSSKGKGGGSKGRRQGHRQVAEVDETKQGKMNLRL
jgi:hypothetical protein